jgi:pyridoxamine 5'-phosphate oxidase
VNNCLAEKRFDFQTLTRRGLIFCASSRESGGNTAIQPKLSCLGWRSNLRWRCSIPAREKKLAASSRRVKMPPMTPEQLAALRQEYSARGLRRAELDPDPIRQFEHWLAEAHLRGLLEPNAMTLATVDAEGQPWTRTVLLKAVDARGFIFFTNYEGTKARHLAHNPRAAITFWWAPLERQVNVTGSVSKTTREESEHYFQSRPLNSRLGAWASRQSERVADRGILEQQLEAARARFGEQETPTPPHWGGYCLRAETVEFWQGRASRLHDRFRYCRREEGAWKIERLSP